MKSSSWLEKKLEVIDNEQKNEMLNFTLLWSLFESKFFKNSASAGKIEKLCMRIKTDLIIDDFKVFLDYFKDRYVDNNSLNKTFNKLSFRNNDKEVMVRNVLLDQEVNIVKSVASLLIIVYRIRNNFFHGKKWEYEIQGQYDNFKIANNILKKILEVTKSEES